MNLHTRLLQCFTSLTRKRPSVSTKRLRQTHFVMESLEGRQLMSVAVLRLTQGLDIQPLLRITSTVTPGDFVSLNPQPLPPKIGLDSVQNVIAPGDFVSLNPQPLPPKIGLDSVQNVIALGD